VIVRSSLWLRFGLNFFVGFGARTPLNPRTSTLNLEFSQNSSSLVFLTEFAKFIVKS
jgi:hypothetical protein